MCLCETKYQGGVLHHSGGVLTSLKKVSRDMGYRSDSIANIARYGVTKPTPQNHVSKAIVVYVLSYHKCLQSYF